LSDALKIITALVGITLILSGLLVGVGYLVLPLLVTGPQAVQANTLLGTLAALGLALGAGLSYEALTALSGRVSSPVHLPPIALLLPLFVGVLVVGQAVLRAEAMAAWLFPPFHVFAIALPILMILRYVAGRTSDLPGRELTLQVGYGAVVSTFLALFLEALLFLTLAGVVLGAVSLFPEGRGWLQDLMRNLQDPLWFQDPANLGRLVLAPPILFIVAFGAVLIAPLIEETIKGLGAAVMVSRQPGRARAFAWGVAAGAGFALVEGMLNGALLLETWTTGVTLRAGASLLHSVTTGIVAVGWRETFARQRPWSLLIALAFTVVLHGLWNALVLGNVIAAVSLAGPGGPPAALPTAGLLGLGSLLGVMIAVCLTLLIVLTNRWSKE